MLDLLFKLIYKAGAFVSRIVTFSFSNLLLWIILTLPFSLSKRRWFVFLENCFKVCNYFYRIIIALKRVFFFLYAIKKFYIETRLWTSKKTKDTSLQTQWINDIRIFCLFIFLITIVSKITKRNIFRLKIFVERNPKTFQVIKCILEYFKQKHTCNYMN